MPTYYGYQSVHCLMLLSYLSYIHAIRETQCVCKCRVQLHCQYLPLFRRRSACANHRYSLALALHARPADMYRLLYRLMILLCTSLRLRYILQLSDDILDNHIISHKHSHQRSRKIDKTVLQRAERQLGLKSGPRLLRR